MSRFIFSVQNIHPGSSQIPKIFDPCKSFLYTKIPSPGIREILTFFNSIDFIIKPVFILNSVYHRILYVKMNPSGNPKIEQSRSSVGHMDIFDLFAF